MAITVIVSLSGYVIISYLIPRYKSFELLTTYFLLFGAYIWLYLLLNTSRQINTGYVLGILFRLSLLGVVPNLSDDVYRFIWDGRLAVHGMNPFIGTPVFFLENYSHIQGIDTSLFDLFGKDTYSSYPPLNQLIFFIAAKLSPGSLFGSILVIRGFILLFELGNIYLIRKLLREYGLPLKRGLLYVLNPLVILELTGNLHFEAQMIFFILLLLLGLKRTKIYLSSLAFGMAVISKLLPLIFLPVIWYRTGMRKGLVLAGISFLVIAVSFLPFLNLKMIYGIFKSLSLYFQWFEFNASIYYLMREVGYWLTGTNIIQAAGPLLGLVTFLMILWLSFSRYAQKGSLTEIFMWLLMIYFAMTTTLHPWYITTLMALSLFTTYRFPLVWTGLIFLTYEGYTQQGYHENYWLIAIEYIIVYGVMLWEIWRKRY